MASDATGRQLIVNEGAAAGAPSTALKVGELLFAGGPPGLPVGREPVVAGDARAQTRRAFDSLSELLATAGGGLGDLVDLVSFHSDSRTIDAAFEVGREVLGPEFPAWTPVACSAQQIPGQTVAISAVAHLGKTPRRCIVPDTIAWWREIPASAGCRKGDLLFVAGQYGSDADGNVNTPGDHAGQARNALNRIAEICELAGADLDDVLNVLSFHQDPRWIAPVEAVYEGEFFDPTADPGLPAWTALGMPGLLKLGMLGQYRAIADLSGGRRVAGGREGSGLDEGRTGAATKERGTVLAATAAAPVDATGSVADRDDPDAQAAAAFALIGESLADLGSSLADVVQVISFHLDPRALDAARRVVGELFEGERAPVWTAAGMTGGRQEGQLHSIHAVAIR